MKTDCIVLAKPSRKMATVNSQDTPEFIERFNKNKISSEMLDSCAKAGRLFKNKWQK